MIATDCPQQAADNRSQIMGAGGREEPVRVISGDPR
jgi:hypothetical protein